MREHALAEDELIMLRGLKAREEQLQDVRQQLAHDHAYVLRNIAARLRLPEKEMGDRYQISIQHGLLIDTHEELDATLDHAAHDSP